MNTFEATRQQLDPAATFDTYRATSVLVIFAIVWSVMTSLFIAGPAGGAVRGLSVLLIVTAGVWLLWAANPLRAPFTRRSMVIVYLFVLSAIVVASLEQLGRSIQGDAWIPVAIGALTVAITPYRPSFDVLVALGCVTVASSAAMVIELPLRNGPGLALTIGGLTPMWAASVGAVFYSRSLVKSLGRWHRRADVAAAALASDMAQGVASSVEREHLAILSRDVVPLFARLIDRHSVTDEDRASARAIADSMRGVMVAGANRTWLSMSFPGTARTAGFLTVDDPAVAAQLMDARQRTAIRAILIAMAEDERVVSVTAQLRVLESVAQVRLVGSFTPDAPAGTSGEYDTYFSVLRVVFDSFRTAAEEHTVTVRFQYDCT